MTHSEREREAQRLMALLSGTGEALMITEDGAVEAGHDEALDAEAAWFCAHCSGETALSGRVIDEATFCRACAPIAETMSVRPCVCRYCDGKCLVYEPRQAGGQPTWQTCPICRGKGWLTWLRTELLWPGSRWPRQSQA